MMDNAVWEFCSCPLCRRQSSNKVIHVFKLSDRKGHDALWNEAPEILSIVRCRSCGLHFLSPRPTEDAMAQLYALPDYFEGGSNGGYDGYADQKTTLAYTFRWLLRRLEAKGLAGGSLLDIGCGPGWFLKEAKPFFKRRVGTDLCKETTEEASRFCDRAIWGGAEDLQDGERFDLVTAIGVLEHVYDPVSFVEHCRALIREGGHLVIVTPDMGGFWHKIMKKRWPSFKLPEHIAFYDKATMNLLATNAGMNLESLFPYHQAFPLGLIFEKLGFRFGRGSMSYRVPVPLPGVMMTGVFGKA